MAVAVFSFNMVNAQTNKVKTNKVVADTVAYQCPMKCEGDKTYDKAGKCPKCNMNFAKVEPKKEKDNHQGHNHN